LSIGSEDSYALLVPSLEKEAPVTSSGAGPNDVSPLALGVEEWTQAQLGALSFDPTRIPQIEVQAVEGAMPVEAAVSPDSSYRLVRSALERAEREVLLYIYNVSAEHMLDLLRDCLSRGVSVRIMYDTHDTRGDEAAKLQSLDGAELKTAPSTGGRDVFTVCHQKFAVIDDSTLLIGSANWAGTSIPLVTEAGRFKKGNREWILVLESPQLAATFKELFEADWDIPDTPTPEGLAAIEVAAAEPVVVPVLLAQPPAHVFDLQEFPAGPALTITPILSPQNYFEAVKALIESATESIVIQQQYILEGGPRTTELLESLAARAAEVEIRIIVSSAFRRVGKKDSWELSVDSLAAHGLDSKLKAMNLDFYTHCHNKGLVVDRRAAVVSSTNWSENSIARAREAGVLVESPAVAGYFADVFDADWEIGWSPEDVPANLAAVFEAAMFQPGAFDEIHPADLV
jgi:phosphatidylserine/phosphatidylglycerophosphate/cardiolipin synthase-like enzyme